MKINEKHIILVKTLMNEGSQPLSSEVLAMTLGTNTKSLKKYLDETSSALEEKAGARIVAKSGSGITLDVFDEPKYEKFFVSFNANYRGSKLLQIRYDPTVIYIVTRLMFDWDESLSADFFA
ncbi:MAG: hypothetical protein IJL94_00490, partial [Erysipelotrichaceae bacterium]|nr:hypothetical protein [Erysipelotrichaceae bacterium]